MTDSLEKGGEPLTASLWMRRTVLVVFCVVLFGAVGVAFTRVIAARIPAQRATLEQLIADRTGLAVRFQNIHFAWGLDGTSAVFEQVELNDPARGRVRVVAPELRVEFDTWDFLRHQQFTLGRVTINSPDIDIIGDPEPEAAAAGSGNAQHPPGSRWVSADEDERTLVRRFTSWAELMPIGRVEVESARVHLLRRGERVARHHITLSQAVVARGSHNLTAFGTMLLSQDIGQSLFISTKLENLGSASGVSGDVRVIARRVLLNKLPALHPSLAGGPLATRGRGTLDARLELARGRVESGSFQMSARELQLLGGKRFDHFTVNGTLHRRAGDLLLAFTDLQTTRGSRLERSPRLSAELGFERGSLRVAQVRFESPRIPFMAAELIAGAFALDLEQYADALPAGWRANAGELRDVTFDSRDRQFAARVDGAEFIRDSDQARIDRFAASIRIDDHSLALSFDAASPVQLTLPRPDPDRPLSRTLSLAGMLTVHEADAAPELRFSEFEAVHGEVQLRADGAWGSGSTPAKPLALEVTHVDRAMLADVWSLMSREIEAPLLADVQQGEIVSGKLSLMPVVDATGQRSVNWQRSRGTLTLASVASAIEGTPALTEAGGTLEFSRAGTQLRLTAGRIEDLRLTEARIDWPRQGAPRLRASLQGQLDSTLLQRIFQDQGLENLSGAVALEADARGEAELRQPEKWRVTAKLSAASIPLAADVPAIEGLSGTLRYANGELRGLALEGTWMGGPVQIESRRATRGGLAAAVSGTADTAPLLELLGHPAAVSQLAGRFAWSGTLDREPEAGEWRLTVASNFSGIESRLPEPFGKSRTRSLPVRAALTMGAEGIRDYEVASGRDSIRGRLEQGKMLARFEVQGVTGEFRAAADAADPTRLAIDRIELKRAPLLLAAAGSLLPDDADLRVDIADLRQADNSLGAAGAALSRREDGVEFSLDSVEDAPHRLSLNGLCLTQDQRCRMDFTVSTRQLPALLEGASLPAEWPASSLRASGELQWRGDSGRDFLRGLSGRFDLETQGEESHHQLVANGQLAEGQIELTNVQGSGPESDQVFRGQGRVGLLARTYDLTVDYEQVSLAATAVPSPARNRIARAWTVIRGSAAQHGWTEAAPARRVQWHGSWEAP